MTTLGQINNLTLYNTQQQALTVCKPHEATILQEISNTVQGLIAQSNTFKDIFEKATSNQTEPCTIHFSENELTINKEKIALTHQTNDIQTGAKNLLQKINNIYNECQRASQTNHGPTQQPSYPPQFPSFPNMMPYPPAPYFSPYCCAYPTPHTHVGTNCLHQPSSCSQSNHSVHSVTTEALGQSANSTSPLSPPSARTTAVITDPESTPLQDSITQEEDNPSDTANLLTTLTEYAKKLRQVSSSSNLTSTSRLNFSTAVKEASPQFANNIFFQMWLLAKKHTNVTQSVQKHTYETGEKLFTGESTEVTDELRATAIERAIIRQLFQDTADKTMHQAYITAYSNLPDEVKNIIEGHVWEIMGGDQNAEYEYGKNFMLDAEQNARTKAEALVRYLDNQLA